MHDVFEVGFRKAISQQELADFIAAYFSLSPGFVMPEHEYWGEQWLAKKRVGISINLAAHGLKTNLAGVSSSTFGEEMLADMAMKAANIFNSEVVVGKFLKCGVEANGGFLSYFPDGSVWESVDSSSGPVSDVKIIRKISGG